MQGSHRACSRIVLSMDESPVRWQTARCSPGLRPRSARALGVPAARRQVESSPGRSVCATPHSSAVAAPDQAPPPRSTPARRHSTPVLCRPEAPVTAGLRERATLESPEVPVCMWCADTALWCSRPAGQHREGPRQNKGGRGRPDACASTQTVTAWRSCTPTLGTGIRSGSSACPATPAHRTCCRPLLPVTRRGPSQPGPRGSPSRTPAATPPSRHRIAPPRTAARSSTPSPGRQTLRPRVLDAGTCRRPLEPRTVLVWRGVGKAPSARTGPASLCDVQDP